MNEKEIKQFLAILKKESEQTPTKEEAESFLKRIGVMTKKGKVAKPYQDVCYFRNQA